MTAPPPSRPPGVEIITPLRVPTGPAAKPAGGGPRRARTAAALLALVALAAAGLWGIGRLERRPEAPPASRPTAPAAAAPELPPVPEPAPPPPPAAPDSSATSEKADAVNRLLASAERRAADGEFSAARSELEAALRLDPTSTAARDALNRVKAHLAAEEFRRRMAEGHTALKAGDFPRARSRFAAARGIRPEAPEAAEALAETEARQRTARIETLRAAAQGDEGREDWPAALAAYEEALAIEPNLQFAQQGKSRASLLAALERRTAEFLGRPQTLYTDAQLENAERLLDEIRAAPRPGARLLADADRLAAQVQAAKTPVPVRIQSDGLTDVSVFRVGRLGRFSSRELNLRPGVYTVVGSRDGYRDERLELTVAPGGAPVELDIRCKDKV